MDCDAIYQELVRGSDMLCHTRGHVARTGAGAVTVVGWQWLLSWFKHAIAPGTFSLASGPGSALQSILSQHAHMLC